ncbi:MAG: hypothetical protein BZ138_02250 [Methanosphaera sp. rholeuAM270]|nr:MAG: hypothetical protein BZ138_02250 [Methanosphaera sp. rholeuAM270]
MINYMIIEFLKENFFYLHPGYTAFNTIIFGIVLGLIIIGIIRIFHKIDKDPLDLMYPLIPIIIFGSSSRALVDNHIYPRIYLLATPGIYISIGLLTIFLLLISVIIEKKYGINYYKVIGIAGLMLCLPNLFIISYIGLNIKIMLFELGLWTSLTGIFILIRSKFKLLRNRGNLEILSAHIFDATSTYVAMEFFGYYEQHVLPTLLINLSNTSLIMYPLKIIAVLVILYIVDREIEDDTTNHMLKLAIFILGLAPGIRNFVTLILYMS